MTRWSESLLKSRVAVESIPIPEGCSADETFRIRELLAIVGGTCATREQVAALRERLEKSLKRGPKSPAVRAVTAAIEEELAEIVEDCEFAQSRRGKFVLFANDWAQRFHAIGRADRGLDGISLAAHQEHERIVASGTASSPDDLVRLVQLLAAHPPGVPIEYRVVVTGDR